MNNKEKDKLRICRNCESEKLKYTKWMFANVTTHFRVQCLACKRAYYVEERYVSDEVRFMEAKMSKNAKKIL